MHKIVLLLAAACSTTELTPNTQATAQYSVEGIPGGDVRHIALQLDVSSYQGLARVELGSQGLQEVWLEVAELDIKDVTGDDGKPLDHVFEHGRLVIPAQGDVTH